MLLLVSKMMTPLTMSEPPPSSPCSNVSGVPTSIRILVLNSAGIVVGNTSVTGVGHGRTLRFATHPTFLGNEEYLATGGIFGGVINVESLQSGVFCTFAVVDAAGPGGAGFPLNAVRVNPHPGTVE
jgi:hypothetical protein